MRSRLTPLAYGLLLATLLPARAGAEPTPASLGVDQAVEAARRNNLELRSAAADSRLKRLARDLSFNKLYPSLTASATAMELNRAAPELIGSSALTDLVQTGVPNAYTLYAPVDRLNLGLVLSVQEVFGVGSFLLMGQTTLDYQASLLGLAKAEGRMAAAVKKTFYQLIVQKEAIALTAARLEAARERLRQARLRYELGQGNELDYSYAEAGVAKLVPELRAMESARAATLAQFQAMLGFEAREDMELVGSLEDEGLALDTQEAARGQRIDLSESALSVRQIASALRIQDAALLPILILRYSADPGVNGPTAAKIFDTSNWRQGSGGLSLTLSWDLSSFLPGSDWRIRRRALEEQLALVQDGAASAARDAANDEKRQRRAVRDSLAKLENLQDEAAATKRTYELTELSFGSGAGRYLDLQAAEISWQSSQMQLLGERLNLMSLVWDFEAKYAQGE